MERSLSGLLGTLDAVAATQRSDSGGQRQQHSGGMIRRQHGDNSARSLLKAPPKLRMNPKSVKRDNWAAIAQGINPVSMA